jgi:guanine deaminase
MSPQTVFYGAVINPQSLISYQVIPNCLIAVSANGQIEWIVEGVIDAMVQETMAQKGCIDAKVIALNHAEFLMPGFIDTHTVRLIVPYNYDSL